MEGVPKKKKKRGREGGQEKKVRPYKKRGCIYKKKKSIQKKARAFGVRSKKRPPEKKRANIGNKKKGGHALQFQNTILGALILC